MLEISLHRINSNIMNKILSTSDSCILKDRIRQLQTYDPSEMYRSLLELPPELLSNFCADTYEKFGMMIERHWDGIAAFCRPENKVALGFVEGLNNKIRVIQRRAYGLRDEEYLRLKILTCMLPATC